jgi:hypothetical protein
MMLVHAELCFFDLEYFTSADTAEPQPKLNPSVDSRAMLGVEDWRTHIVMTGCQKTHHPVPLDSEPNALYSELPVSSSR